MKNIKLIQITDYTSITKEGKYFLAEIRDDSTEETYIPVIKGKDKWYFSAFYDPKQEDTLGYIPTTKLIKYANNGKYFVYGLNYIDPSEIDKKMKPEYLGNLLKKLQETKCSGLIDERIIIIEKRKGRSLEEVLDIFTEFNNQVYVGT